MDVEQLAMPPDPRELQEVQGLWWHRDGDGLGSPEVGGGRERVVER